MQRGEYVQRLPTGLVRLADKRVITDPDRHVQQVIELVWHKFEELGACYRVMRYGRQHDIQLPRRERHGREPGEVRWRTPAELIIRSIVTNPAYAGAFVYGRRPHEPGRHSPVRRSIADWQCVLHDVYPAYISWSQLLANQER